MSQEIRVGAHVLRVDSEHLITITWTGQANQSATLITGERSVLTLDGAPHRRARRLLMPCATAIAARGTMPACA